MEKITWRFAGHLHVVPPGDFRCQKRTTFRIDCIGVDPILAKGSAEGQMGLRANLRYRPPSQRIRGGEGGILHRRHLIGIYSWESDGNKKNKKEENKKNRCHIVAPITPVGLAVTAAKPVT